VTRPVRTILIFLLLLIPSAHFVWKNRQMPQFAYLHDDGILFVSAKSVAADSYRIASLPDAPYQTKFPPLFPLYLSAIWRLNPNFPDNLRLASLFAWIPLAAYLALAWAWYRQSGMEESRVWLLVALLAVNPYVMWFGTFLFSDVFFTCGLLATLLAAARGGVRMALLAGVLGGCAYLSRTTGIALLISVPAWMAWKKDWRRAAAFIAGMLPAVIGWSLWTSNHKLHTSDGTLIFYTDYIRYLLQSNVRDLPLMLWKNVDQLLYAMGSMALPRIDDSLPLKILTQVIAAAMIAGTVRMMRRGLGRSYGLFALVSVGFLLVCDFPSTERYILPLYPLLLAGLLCEIEHLAHALKAGFHHRDFSQRAAAAAFSTVVAAVWVGALAMQFFMTFVFLQASLDEKLAKLRDQKLAYTWIAANLPDSAKIFSYDDPLLYLYTGRQGIHRPLDPMWWYREDHASIQETYRNLALFCRSRGLEYVYFTTGDLARETGPDDQREVQRLMRTNPELTPVFTAGIGTVYKVRRVLPE
jgi:hypothetical protein